MLENSAISPRQIRRLTSLLRVEEKLKEANYFCKLMSRQRDGEAFGYSLNAFLSAARSVTFLVQKEMRHVPGFEAWWAERQTQLARDEAARFFLNLRNFSQKEGNVSLVGTRDGQSRRWTYRFAGNAQRVPSSLLHRDVVNCCREHLAKLAKIILCCAADFPFHVCPSHALTIEGVAALKLDVRDLATAAGLPVNWLEVVGIPAEDRLRILRAHVDAVDFAAIQRLSRWKAKSFESNDLKFGERLARSLVEQLENERCVALGDVILSSARSPLGSPK